MKTPNIIRKMTTSLIGATLLIALPASAEKGNEAGEILEWQQSLSQEILSGGRNAIETMATNAREQMRFRLKLEENSRLQRLGQELEQRKYHFTTTPTMNKPELVQIPSQGSRSAIVINNGFGRAGDIPWQTTR